MNLSFVVVFNLVLTVLTGVTGIVWLIEKLVLLRRRKAAAAGGEVPPPSAAVDFCVSLFPVIFVVFVLRSFVVEPFRIPSGSMIPTLHVGDFILVNKFDYGLRCPVGNCKLIDIGEPKRGDVVVFKFPENPSLDFIKRVIGLPGDHVQYIDKVLTVNGDKIDYRPAALPSDSPPAQRFTEDLKGIHHDIQMIEGRVSGNVDEVVPEGSYFMMGDNRDESNDSRYWGFVPEANLKGKAMVIWMSWDNGPVLSRFFKLIR
jgi:signal peptidase I